MRRIALITLLGMTAIFPLLVGATHLLCMKNVCTSLPKTSASETSNKTVAATESHSHCGGSKHNRLHLTNQNPDGELDNTSSAPCCCNKGAVPLLVYLPPVQPYPNSANFVFSPIILAVISTPSASQVSAQEYHPPPLSCHKTSVLRL